MGPLLFELVASGNKGFVQDHIDRMPIYKDLLQADEAWILHFTREDEYLTHPHWQSDTELKKGVNMVYFWHDGGFTTVRMSARWKDVNGNIQQIDDQPLTV